MPEQDGLNPADQELEAALRSLAPAAARIDPVAAAFAAGQLAMRRQLRRWQAATAAMVLISAGAWLVPVQRERLAAIYVGAGAPLADAASAAQPRSDQSLFMLRQAVWEKGVDGLPAVQLLPATSKSGDAFSILRGES